MKELHKVKLARNEQLRALRHAHGLTQGKLAERLGTTVVNISRWENRETVPSPYFRKRLCELFKTSEEELGFSVQRRRVSLTSEKETPSRSTENLWSVPHQRNPLFTGRENILKTLHTILNMHSDSTTQPLAISGLGGIGKTQTTIEYIYRYSDNYTAVFWVRADTYDLLISDFLYLALLLKLPEHNESDQQLTVRAVLRWLDTHEKWLLVLDNADEMEVVRSFIPSAGKGHVLITTRAQAGGTLVQHIQLESLSPEESVVFLLRRVKFFQRDSSVETVPAVMQIQAREIAREMAYLPLALDQAGAYIEETGCNIDDYIQLCRTRRSKLLSMRGMDVAGHPESVMTTWSLSFERIKQVKPAAAELLHLFAFMHPGAISEVLIVKGAAELGPPLQAIVEDPFEFNESLRELLRFSLIKRSTETKMLTIHRLVQIVLKDGLSKEIQREWITRVVRMINRVFPEGTFTTWPERQQILPHVQVCAELVEQMDLLLPEAAELFHRVGHYLRERGQYKEAESFLQQALSIREKIEGAFHPAVAQILNDLGALLRNSGQYEQAEPLFLRAISIRKESLGAIHPDVAQSLNDLGALYWYQGRYTETEPFYQEALAIRQRVLEEDHPKLADSLGNLGLLLYEQGKYKQAEPLQLKALTIRENVLGPTHPYTAISLNNLGLLYWRQGDFEQAAAYHKRAFAIWERELGSGHPNTATSLNNLGLLSSSQQRYAEAESLFQRALIIRQERLEVDHPHIAYSLNGLARTYHARGQYTEAELLYQKALSIREKNPSHPDLAETLHDLAQLYLLQKRYKLAERNFERALTIRLKNLGSKHPDTLQTLQEYTALLQRFGRKIDVSSELTM